MKTVWKFRILLQTESAKYQYTDVLNYFKSEMYNEIINLNQSTQMSVILQLMAPLYWQLLRFCGSHGGRPSTLKVEATDYSERLVTIYQITRRHTPDYCNLLVQY